MSESERERDAAAACETCGLCCSGLLFARVRVKEEDTAARERLGLGTAPDGVPLPHPCRCLNGTLCSIYDDRSGNCRTYQCETRREILRGETTLARARARIADVKDRLAALDPLAETLMGRTVRATGFRPFTYAFIAAFEKKQARGLKATGTERAVIRQSLEILKIVDRHFRETSRIRFFAGFLYDVEAGERDGN